MIDDVYEGRHTFMPSLFFQSLHLFEIFHLIVTLHYFDTRNMATTVALICKCRKISDLLCQLTPTAQLRKLNCTNPGCKHTGHMTMSGKRGV